VSQENVDLILTHIQPPAEVDFVPLFRNDEVWEALRAALSAHYDPDIEIVARGLPDGDREGTGVEILRELWLEWLRPWSAYRAEVVEARDLGDRVMLLYRSMGRLEGSDAEVEDELASLWTVRDAKVVRAEFFATSHAEALAAVGVAR
jgi:ketosteroid isomerase-like protein